MELNHRWITLVASAALVVGVVYADHGSPHGGPDRGPLGNAIMGRLRTIGFEVGIGNILLDGFGSITDTALKRSGAQSAKSVDAAFSDPTEIQFAVTTDALKEVYGRAYFNFTDYPTSTVTIMTFRHEGATRVVSVRMTSDGRLQLFNNLTATQIGADSAVVPQGVWLRIELYAKTDPTTGAAELRLDGTTLAQANNLNTGTGLEFAFLNVGWDDFAGANRQCNIDDVAINDTSGTDQNSWPGPGQILLLKPISDNQRGTWTGGAGGTTNLFDAVNNTPPIGTASETDLTQIESADSSGDNATDEYRVNMTTYADAGISGEDDVVLVQAVVDHGEDIATGAKTGSFLILSNPAQGSADTFTFGDDVGALGTWPTNWRAKWGSAQHSPVVTLATSPVLRIRKTDGTTRVGSVDFMGIYVEYRDNAPVIQPMMGLLSPIFVEP